jgi:hypothetical protein
MKPAPVSRFHFQIGRGGVLLRKGTPAARRRACDCGPPPFQMWREGIPAAAPDTHRCVPLSRMREPGAFFHGGD